MSSSDREPPASAPAEGYSVCARCFGDDDIQAFIGSQANSQVCDFCGRESRTRATAAPLPDVVDFILAAINREYQDAADALGYESAEGGYQGGHWDSRELLEDVLGLELPNDEDGRLLSILAECLGDQVWCERDPYALRRDQRLVGSWEDFSESIKHKRRYFFLEQNGEQRDDLREYLDPSELLEFIGDTVSENELIKVLPTGSLIYRARQTKSRQLLYSPYDFGPPSTGVATRSNRMSPAGIVMFYGSDDWRTAVAEIDDDLKLGIAVGTFRTTRDARILDLTNLPTRLGFFEQQSDSSTVDRYALEFLHRFVQSVAARIEPGAREHVDYVPTQVVTEWFRTKFRHYGSALDGVRYPSTQRPGGNSLVLFADRHAVVLSQSEISEVAAEAKEDEWWVRAQHEKAWLLLVRRRRIRAPATNGRGPRRSRLARGSLRLGR
jgi:HEPN/RES N-terminal domain 1/RES domain